MSYYGVGGEESVEHWSLTFGWDLQILRFCEYREHFWSVYSEHFIYLISGVSRRIT